MTTYESKIKSINAPAEDIFNKLSDLTLVKPALDKINDERLKDVKVEADSIYFSVENFGEMGIKMVNAEPYKTLKYESDKSPLAFNFWVQLVQVSETDTRMKLTLKADIPVFIKPMLGNKIEEGMETIANVISNFNYK